MYGLHAPVINWDDAELDAGEFLDYGSLNIEAGVDCNSVRSNLFSCIW